MTGILAAVAEPKRKATYADVLAAPEQHVAEILDGDLFVSPRPASPHGRASAMLYRQLGPFDPAGDDLPAPGGWWICIEPEVHLDGDVVVPDIAAWRRERMPRIPSVAWFDLPPDWVCETLSPSTVRMDRGRKLALYARASIAHVWLLDPLARTLEMLHLGSDGRYGIVAVHTGDELVRGEPFEAVAIDLKHLWLD